MANNFAEYPSREWLDYQSDHIEALLASLAGRLVTGVKSRRDGCGQPPPA
jgi:hypothetical protein